MRIIGINRLIALNLTLAAMLSCADSSHADQGGLWINQAPLSLARQEVGAARIGDKVYVVGGLVSNNPLTATETVEAYHIPADTWEFVAPLPFPLDHASVVSLNGELYVLGGYSADFIARQESVKYDPDSDSWSTIALLPSPRGGAWAVAHGGKIYLFGGRLSSGGTRSTFIYDPAVDQWSVGQDMPSAREHLTAGSAGGFMYVFGGRDGVSLSANERYDPINDQWEVMAPMPTARSAMAVATFAGKIFVMGGESPGLFDVNEVYDVTTDTWSCATPMPLARHGVAAVTLDNRIFLPGGGTVAGLAPTAHADSFLPPLPPPVPSVSGWGSASFALLVLTGGSIVLRRRTDVPYARTW